jgi:D-3-phosphoglycerate dehydrogenase / 2-oxoglutarate reductase
MADYRVLRLGMITPESTIEKEILSKINAEVVVNTSTDESSIINDVRDADAIIVRGLVPITDSILKAASKCKIVAQGSVGFDNIDISAAGRRNIYVSNSPASEWCVDEVSDITMMLILGIERKAAWFHQKVKEGYWREKLDEAKPIFALRGQTLGLFALGAIARAVAQKAKPFGFKIIATDPYVSAEEAKKMGIGLVAFDTLLKTSDVISIHAPLMESTFHVFNRETIGKMKKTAFLVNAARGPLIDQKALYDALKAGQLAGAAFDVLEDEPPKPGEPLLTLDNIFVVPHIGAYSETSVLKPSIICANEVVRVLKGEPPLAWVNRKEMQK